VPGERMRGLEAVILKAFGHLGVREQACIRMIASWLELRLHCLLFDIAKRESGGATGRWA
jgi:hypothetical protein